MYTSVFSGLHPVGKRGQVVDLQGSLQWRKIESATFPRLSLGVRFPSSALIYRTARNCKSRTCRPLFQKTIIFCRTIFSAFSSEIMDTGIDTKFFFGRTSKGIVDFGRQCLSFFMEAYE